MKFKRGTVWKVSKVSFVNQNPKYLGYSCKVLIDMNMSTFQPMLQSAEKMPTQPAPPEDLATLLSCPEGQVVDVIALVTHVSQPVIKTTPYGQRNLVDVTIMDDSGTHGAAECKFPAWFPKTSTDAPCDQLASLIQAAATRVPVAFFNFIVIREVGAAGRGDKETKTTLKTSREKFHFQICECGARSERLKNNAAAIAATHSDQITVVTEMPTFANKEIDYRGTEGIFTVRRF